MVSGTACRPEPGVPPSRHVVAKVESGSLPEYETLRNPREFRRVLSAGNRVRSGGVVVAATTGGEELPRVGLVVSKGSGNAVTRNRIKRRLRHAVRELRLQPGMNYVIIANSQVATVPFERVVEWLRRAVEIDHV
jgi:ribonuclease P protein component